MKFKVFILDDDTSFAMELETFLQQEGYQTARAETLAVGKTEIANFQPDILLLDLNLPDGEGLEFLPYTWELSPETSVVILSGYGSIPAAVKAIKQGAEDFLTKPADPEYLKILLERLLERKQLRKRLILEGQENGSRNEFVVGTSRAIHKVIETCQAAAQSDSTVLLQGETGTGKQLLANYIHDRSNLKNGPFVYVNCASLSDTLLESDLFGHERGAFTGAHKLKRGRVELAHAGTLFLDEIAEMSLPVQAKLLHFIEYGEFQRVGGVATFHPNVRIICATHKHLKELAGEGSFRADLFYRINVIPINIPPLRERPEDIPPLLDYYLDKFSRELKRERPRLSEGLKEKLQAYPWPGNARELRNAVERALILSHKFQLTEKDFPFFSESPPLEKSDLFAPRPLQNALADFKEAFIRRVLAFTGGNQTKAAKILQIQRTYLNRLVRN